MPFRGLRARALLVDSLVPSILLSLRSLGLFLSPCFAQQLGGHIECEGHVPCLENALLQVFISAPLFSVPLFPKLSLGRC